MLLTTAVSFFALLFRSWLKTWLKDGLGIIYTLPDRKRLSGPLLDAEYERVCLRVDKALEDLAYYQLSSDGWSNIRGEAIIGYVVTCCKGDYYIDSTDASLVEKKSAEWCFADYKRIITKGRLDK